ncbi:hypothetical protein [Streptomyces sp. CBMA152]|uniref:hypothetical protein n=1 Tax=Streptomyces sp. CBMA152 TaxID=1896312 RepID=UPI001660D54D|nr:hypothetical protein [Streptomyces sp. CBMA152]MBD0744369.1 hypothetical protein [Streptomyces sp. CBMA152]
MRTSRLLWAGLAAVACGAVLCVAGWYGVSGERFAARQIPYLASCTVPGAALLVAGAVLLARVEAAPEVRRPAEAPEEPGPSSSDGPLLCVPGGTLAHRPDCPLVAARPDARPVGDKVLDPCPVCEP